MSRYLGQLSSKQLIPISLSTLLSCTAITWIATTAINPAVTWAKPVEFNLPVYRQPQESYEQLMQRAQQKAKTTINNAFKQNPAVNEIKVVVVGENKGAIAPLLTVQVSRQGWINEPQLQRWATYFADSKLLLGLDQPAISPAQAAADSKPSSPTPQGEQPPATANKPQTPQAEKPPQPQQPQQIPLLDDPAPERQRNPLPVPTQRLRNAGNDFPFVDPIDVQQLRPDLVR